MSDTWRQSAGNESVIWLAGFIDGEGSIVLAKRTTDSGVRFLPLVSITNTHKDTIEEIHRILEENGIGHHIIPYKSKRFERAKKIYTVHINGMGRVTRFLDVFQCFLRTKKQQAGIVRRFIEYRLSLPNKRAVYGKTEFSLREDLQGLNKFGSSETLRAAPAMQDEDKVQAPAKSGDHLGSAIPS